MGWVLDAEQMSGYADRIPAAPIVFQKAAAVPMSAPLSCFWRGNGLAGREHPRFDTPKKKNNRPSTYGFAPSSRTPDPPAAEKGQVHWGKDAELSS